MSNKKIYSSLLPQFRFFGITLYIFLSGVGLPLAAAPANDCFESPTLINNFPVILSATNKEATMETMLYEKSPHSGSASIWFEWTAQTSQSVQVDTLGSDFDTVLAVWLKGRVLNALDQVASNNDAADGKQSLVTFEAVAGTTYLIAVYGYVGNTGNVKLTLKREGDTTEISGKVTAPDGVTPLAGIIIDAMGESMWDKDINRVTSASDGSYTFTRLLPGSYTIVFNDPDDRYIPATYSDTDGTVIEVSLAAPDSKVANIDVSFKVNGKVSGTVTTPDGLPLSGVSVRVFHRVNDLWEPYEIVYYVMYDDTRNDGTYSLYFLQPGTYRILFEGGLIGDIAYRNEYYNDAPTLDAAQDIVITNQNHLFTGIDVSMGILPPPEIIDFSRTAPNRYTMNVDVVSGHTYRLLNTLDLDEWFYMRSFTASSDEEELTIDFDESKFPESFWRIKIDR